MNWLIDQLAKEWAVIKQTPIAFIFVCVLSLLIAFFFVRWMYKERLDARDDLIGYYREKLGLLPDNKSRFSAMRNSELRAAVLSLTPQLRGLVQQATASDPNEFTEDWRAMLAGNTDEERRQIMEKRRDEHDAKRTQQANDALNTYNQKYKTDVILLRDEMLLRLPPEQRSKFEPFNYRDDHIVNSFMIEMAADKLEKMAKLLPE